MDNQIKHQETQDSKSETFLKEEASFDLQQYAKDLFFTSLVPPKQDNTFNNQSKKQSNDKTR